MYKLFKRTKYLLFSFLTMLTILISSSCVVEQPKENFETFTNSVFQTLIGKDEFTSNFLFNNPESFGLERYEPSLPTPGKTQALGLLIINLYLGQIKGFNYDELNEDQQITYDIIVNLLDNINAKTPNMSYLSNNYLGSYLGYQAQLPILLAEYHFKDKLDVENYFKYLDLVPETFKSYVDFEIEKADNGYGMPDFVIDKVVSQCENFISLVDSNEHFMITVVNEKIDSLEFLTFEEKEEYKKINAEKINGPLIEGYAYVKDNLPLLKGRATNNMGLAHYVEEDGTMIGRNYYEIDFQDSVGYTITIPEAKKYIEGKIAYYEAQKEHFREIIQNNPNFTTDVKNVQFMYNTPEEQLNLYQTIIYSHFPQLNLSKELNVQVKYVHESMQDNFSPAAYITSPIDEFNNESIFLNNKSIMTEVVDENGDITYDYDYNYLFTTLGHEGFPGHLYQNVYFKNKDVNILRKVLKCTGYTEGWATYVENYMYNFLEGYDQDVIDYYIFQEEYQGAIYSRLDMGIHYDGWTLEETHEFLTKYYNITIDQTKETYQRLIEVPNNCQYYYFTFFKFKDMYDKVSSALGENFDPIEYHQKILDLGPAPMRFVEQRVLASYGLE